MPKINQEEYEVLKEHYDMGGEWISRDADGLLYYHKERPHKLEHSSDNVWDSNSFPMDTIGDGKKLFHFVRWTDSEPYNIAELIGEYEKYKKASDYFKVNIKNVNQSMLDDLPTESEETEAKKDLNWFKEQLDDIEMNTPRLSSHDSIWMLDRVNKLLNQLDEPEVLSQEWIDKNKFEVNGWNEAVHVEDLQNLLVPKQELPVIPKFVAELLRRNKKDNFKLIDTYGIALERGSWADRKLVDWLQEDWTREDIFARAWLDGFTVEKEQKYYVLDKEGATLLRKSAAGEGVAPSIGANIYNVKRWENEGKYRLTEQEIKDYDERFWPFAVKVEELEE